jgi:hypothetical protein
MSQLDWEAIARANTHPLRVSILEALAKEGGRTMSPNGLSRELNAPLSNTSFHVIGARKQGLIELSYTRPRRGATEHFYELSGGGK